MTLQEMVSAYFVIGVGELQHLGATRLSHFVILSSSPFHNQTDGGQTSAAEAERVIDSVKPLPGLSDDSEVWACRP